MDDLKLILIDQAAGHRGMINGECASDSKEATRSTLRLWITVEEVGDESLKPDEDLCFFPN